MRQNRKDNNTLTDLDTCFQVFAIVKDHLVRQEVSNSSYPDCALKAVDRGLDEHGQVEGVAVAVEARGEHLAPGDPGQGHLDPGLAVHQLWAALHAGRELYALYMHNYMCGEFQHYKGTFGGLDEMRLVDFDSPHLIESVEIMQPKPLIELNGNDAAIFLHVSGNCHSNNKYFHQSAQSVKGDMIYCVLLYSSTMENLL